MCITFSLYLLLPLTPNMCCSTVPGATRKHPNPGAATGAMTTYKRPPKQSVRRREAMFSSNDALPGQEEELVLHALPAEVSVDNRTDQEARGYLEWVSCPIFLENSQLTVLQAEMIMTTYPYPVPPPPGTFAEPRSLPVFTARPAAHAPELPPSATAALQASVDRNTLHLQQLLVCVGAAEPAVPLRPATSSSFQLPPVHAQPEPLLIRTPTSSPSSQPTSCAGSPVSNIPPSYRSLVFADGTRLRFMESQVPDPPPTTFSDNIPRLNAIWDGCALHPADESPLIINGKHIPLIYWPQVYKYWKADQWKGTKGKWFEWKVKTTQCL